MELPHPEGGDAAAQWVEQLALLRREAGRLDREGAAAFVESCDAGLERVAEGPGGYARVRRSIVVLGSLRFEVDRARAILVALASGARVPLRDRRVPVLAVRAATSLGLTEAETIELFESVHRESAFHALMSLRGARLSEDLRTRLESLSRSAEPRMRIESAHVVALDSDRSWDARRARVIVGALEEVPPGEGARGDDIEMPADLAYLHAFIEVLRVYTGPTGALTAAVEDAGIGGGRAAVIVACGLARRGEAAALDALRAHALELEDPHLRRFVVFTLGESGSSGDARLLERVEAEDPWAVAAGGHGGEATVYPVRAEARAALRKIRSRAQ